MFKEIVTQRKFINYKTCKKGDLLVEGKLVKTIPNKFGKGNVDWVFEPEDGGPHVVLNHSGDLAYKFKEYGVVLGDIARVVYDGETVIQKGAYKGKPVHNFRVWLEDTKEQKSKVVEEEVPKVEKPKKPALKKVEPKLEMSEVTLPSVDELDEFDIDDLE